MRRVVEFCQRAVLPVTLAGVWVLSLGLVGLITLRALAPVEVNFNEGWNAYFQSMAARGENIYPPPTVSVFNNYPPLSFYLIGFASTFGADVVTAGRIVSLVSVAATSLFAGVVAMRLSEGGRLALLVGAGTCLALLVVTFSDYVGVNDPQFMAQAVMVAAMAIYVGNNKGTSTLVLAVALIAIAVAIKHNLLAFPLALALDQWISNRRHFGRFLLIVATAGLLLGAWMHLVSDARIWSALLSPRMVSIGHMLEVARQVGKSLGVVALVLMILTAGRLFDESRRLVMFYLVASLVIGTFFARGDGVNTNIFIDLVIAMAIAIGLGVSELFRAPGAVFLGLRLPVVGALLLLTAIAGAALTAENDMQRLLQRDDQQSTERFHSTTEHLRARPGGAMCVPSQLLCYRAGKKLLYDFNTGQAIQTGRLPMARLIDVMRDEDVQTVVLSEPDSRVIESGGASSAVTPFLQEIGMHYRPEFRRADGLVFWVRSTSP